MIGVALRAAGLAVVYLCVLTSIDPYDVMTGLLLGVAVALALRPRTAPAPGHGLTGTPSAVVLAWLSTAREMVVGTGRVVRFCVRPGRAAPGFVEVPRGTRTRADLALWGLLTGEAPDEVPVDVDEARGVLLVHLVDASDPEAVRERHRIAHERMARG